MHILFNGCSYTYGDELLGRERNRFSTLVSNELNATHDNISECGRGNDAIARTTMEWFNAGNTCDLAIIQWSVLSRIEGWNLQWKYYECITVQTPRKWDKFYKQYYHAQLGVDTVWKNQYLLEQYFIKNNIKYMFIFHDSFKSFRSINKENKAGDKWTEFERIDEIWEYPCVWRDLVTCKDYHYVIANDDDNHSILTKADYEGKNSHPNEIGHRKIAHYILDRVKK
ncbi:MAG: hypothetical protein ACFFEY_19820 [Candidatus Thorarchaeota archaeon]